MINVKPVHDNILVQVEVIEKNNKTASGIITSSVKETIEKKNMGKVISVGEGRLMNNGTLIPSSVKVGDRIMWSSFAGVEIQGETETELYLLIKENDVLAIL